MPSPMNQPSGKMLMVTVLAMNRPDLKVTGVEIHQAPAEVTDSVVRIPMVMVGLTKVTDFPMTPHNGWMLIVMALVTTQKATRPINAPTTR